MKIAVLLAAGAIVASAANEARAQAPQAPQPDPNAPVYIVSYIDALQTSKSQAIALLKQFRTACAKEDGNLRCEAVQRMEQQNDFSILEIWKDQKSYQAHAAGAGAQLRDKLKPMLGSPYDERVHIAMNILPPQPAPSGRVVYVITHVDVIPPKVNDATAAFAPMADATRKDPGNARLDVLQQLGLRANHFSVVEVWGNRRQLETHQALPRTIQYREQIQSTVGAPYDERLYKILD